MEFRTILAAVSGGKASAGVVELACRLARRFASHLEAYHVRFDPRELVVMAADGLGTPLTGDIIETATRDAAAAAAHAQQMFDAAVKRHAIARRAEPPPLGSDPALLHQASAHWHEEVGYGAVKVADRARLFDLTILGRSGRVTDEPYSDAIEEALLSAGRPVLVAPVEAPAVIGETVALAWNDSAEAAKAVAASLPVLTRARQVYVLSVGKTGGAALAQHLAWYGIRAGAEEIYPVKGVGAGELVLAAARDRACDLLVMGGYSRAPWREMLFGGATREVVGTSLLPLLLSH
jgi:nucleotide-binding universal stress UspA family protein